MNTSVEVFPNSLIHITATVHVIELALTTTPAYLFSESGQLLLNEVFGTLASEQIRNSVEYESIAYEYDQKTQGISL